MSAITITREAAQQVLDALQQASAWGHDYTVAPCNKAIVIMQAAIDVPAAQTEEPFGWLFEGTKGICTFAKSKDCVKPVLDLYQKIANEDQMYKLTPLFTRSAIPPSGDGGNE